MTKLKIYPAGKLSAARFIIDLAKEWTEFEFVAHWPELVLSGADDSSIESAPDFWAQDFADIRRADVLILFPAAEGNLRGALVEAGFALASGKPVICIGSDPGYGTWQYSKRVFRVPGLPEAKMLLLTMGVAKS
jgi:nucleoside 2-deoxyribosyltransferase